MRAFDINYRAATTRLRSLMVRAMSVSAVAALTLNPAFTPVIAADYGVKPTARAPAPAPVDTEMNARPLSLGIGKSVVIDLPHDIKDVLVADPKIANAVVRSSQRAYIIGAAVGETNIVFFDADGQQIAAYDVAVKRDLNGLRATLKQILPNSDIQVDGVGSGIILTGSVANAMEAQQANELAARIAGGTDSVVNSIVIRGRDQVMLKVTVAEVARSVIKQLGIDLTANLSYGTSVVNFNNATPFGALGADAVPGNKLGLSFGGTPSVTATLRAMETAGIVHTLAEPNLTTVSGESANFTAGGEFPVTGTSISCTGSICTPSIEFKKFGVGLSFTPVVMTEGRISLKVATEVSEVSLDNSMSVQAGIAGNSGTVTIPSIKTRKVETTVEIPSGGSMAMAGLIQQQTKQAVSGLPGLMRLPVLGSLFRSKDYVNNQTELMILVTPYIVHAVAQKDLSRPGDGFVTPSDPQAQLLGSINRIYGAPGRTDPAQNYRGTYGFITD